MIDATYKLNKLRLPLIIIMKVNGNGASEIVAFWIVYDEGRHTVTEMIKISLKHGIDRSAGGNLVYVQTENYVHQSLCLTLYNVFLTSFHYTV
jgi:hypothetical protein